MTYFSLSYFEQLPTALSVLASAWVLSSFQAINVSTLQIATELPWVPSVTLQLSSVKSGLLLGFYEETFTQVQHHELISHSDLVVLSSSLALTLLQIRKGHQSAAIHSKIRTILSSESLKLYS